ncbi:hypothetical protein [Cerasicoccus frondis]|uniref:hypothetical protein n=1 Tax=Cerasicoccus frondis TaxID=490090 RepID=UPI0028525695|nr:hypothetical protein [Cerasicoccus frondis]
MKATTIDPNQAVREAIEAYAAKYDYDVSYMLHMLEHNPAALQLFQQVIPLANCRQHAPLDVFFVAKLAAFRQSDCGACLQLSIRLALEAGVSRDIVVGAVKGTPALPPHLADVQRFVQSLDDYSAETNDLRKTLRARYGEAALIEIALVVTAAYLFPRTKRVLGYFESCQLMQFDFE